MTTIVVPANPWPAIEVVRQRVLTGKATADEVQAAEQAAILASPASMLAVIDPSFTQPRHVRIMDQHLVALDRGCFDRLMIVAPPRHGKSTLASKSKPVWRLRQDTGSQQAIITFGSDLSTEFGGWCRDAITNNPGLGIRVRQTSKAKDRFNLAGAIGGLYAVGIGGPLSGRGFHDGQLDDIVKDAVEANSQVTRDMNWDWYWSVFLTRRTRVNRRVTIGAVWTRWHEDDLGGRLLSTERDRWCVLHLRAVADHDETLATITDASADMLARWDGDEVSWDRKAGEALWPEVYGLDYLSEYMSNRYTFSALYQGDPVAAAGNLFRRDDFRYWKRVRAAEGELWMLPHDAPLGEEPRPVYVRPRDCRMFAVADLAASTRTSADWTVISVWAVTPQGDMLLVDRYRGRIAEDRHWSEGQKLHARWKFSWLGIEKGFIGSRLTYDAARAGLTVREYDPRVADKVTRAMPAVDRYGSGRIWHPDPATHPWVTAELEPELLAFNNGAHDDWVDNVAMATHFVPNPDTLARSTARHAPTAENAIADHIKAYSRQKRQLHRIG